jgi:protein-L-isoaspartate(D-aspartate) O-methyltransferase
MELDLRRRFYAEEIEAVANLRTPALVEALAAVPRERFLRPGPWTMRSEADLGSPPRQTADDDPRHVYHNLALGIDPSRQLFNGAPGIVAMAIDRLQLKIGARVLHVGTGLGYYTAIIARTVGPSGRVVGIEADEKLAAESRANLASMPWVEAGHGDAREPLAESFDAILINAGVTHPEAWWLTSLAEDGRMVLPVTAAMPAMGATIGKGPMIFLKRTADPLRLEVRMVTFVAIYSAVGLRDEALNAKIGKALQRSPFPSARSLRLDPHEETSSCWLHATGFCLSE